MDKLHYDIDINAPREKVWQILWNDDTYRKWAAAFYPGSFMETDWKEGSKVLFLGPDRSGMVSKLNKKVDNEYMSFTHLGELHKGVEDLTSDRVKAFAGLQENYTLKDMDGKTRLSIDMDANEEFKKMFEGMWPKAIQIIKELSEAN
jgi:uncharacterized protein YndB with AHSA1/START domain